MRSIWCVVAAGLLISAVARPLDARWRGWEANRSEKWQPNSVPSGYDPFQLNWSTGRFQYVPIPYDTFSGPYAFNWHSGRWDYVPYAPPPAVEYFNGKRDEGSMTTPLLPPLDYRGGGGGAVGGGGGAAPPPGEFYTAPQAFPAYNRLENFYRVRPGPTTVPTLPWWTQNRFATTRPSAGG